MKKTSLLLLTGLLLACVAVAEEQPDWAARQYAAPPDKVLAAGLHAIQAQKYDVKNVDHERRQINFHVGMSALSRGYNMILSVEQVDATHCRVVIGLLSKTGGRALSWGSGKKETLKIFSTMDAEIATGKPAIDQ